MPDSKARLLSKLAQEIDTSGNLTNAGLTSPGSGSGIVAYDSAGVLPTSGLSNGDQGWASNRLFISNGSGWYNVSLVNLSPSITSGPDGANYSLDSNGGTATSITISASDSDGTPIIWSYNTSDSAYELATIANDSDGTFTVTAKTLADILAAGYDSSGGSFTITFKASDGISFDTDSADFSITYVVSAAGLDWSSPSLAQEIGATDGDNGHFFGRSAQIDGNYAVFGAPGLPTNGAGGAYVFFNNSGTWSQQAKLLPSDLAATDRVGDYKSIAIHNDTIILGAPHKNTQAGAVYAFTRSGTTWSQQQKITPAVPRSYENFGSCVDISGNTCIIGGPMNTNGTHYAYVYNRSGSTWSLQTRLDYTGNPTDGSDTFAFSVAIDSDTNTAVVGAIDGGTGGQAHVFTRSGSSWTHQATLAPTDLTTSDLFGGAVSISGSTIAVGAYHHEVSTLNNDRDGAVYIFTGSGSSWTQQQKLISDSASPSAARFGQSIDLDRDDSNILAIGEPRAFPTQRGQIHMFERSGSTWSRVSKIVNPDNENDNFGAGGGSVSINGTYLAVGAEFADSTSDGQTNQSNAGQGYIYQGGS